YLEALHSGRAINAEDAWTDPRVNELGRGYLIPLNIRAILDASIRIDGEVVGVLCLEQQHRTRYWQADEMAFAGELADHFAQVMISQQRRDASGALYLLRRAVEQSASAFLLVGREGVVEYVNGSFTAITLFGADEIQGRPLTELP